MPHAQFLPSEFTPQDGVAEVEGTRFTVVANEAIFSDADGDGQLDALVPVEAYSGGKSVDRQWYIWAARDGEAMQVPLPVAQTVHCGTQTYRVAAAAEGFEIPEYRLATGESSYLSCADQGSDDRIRTIAIGENADGLWPVQVAPVPGFGGICPGATEFNAYPTTIMMHTLPSTDADALTGYWQPGQAIFHVGLHEPRGG